MNVTHPAIWFLVSTLSAFGTAAADQLPPGDLSGTPGGGTRSDPFRLTSEQAARQYARLRGREVIGATYAATPRGRLLLRFAVRGERVSDWFFELGLADSDYDGYIDASAARGKKAALTAKAATVLGVLRDPKMVAVLERSKITNLFAALALGDHYRASDDRERAAAAYRLAADLDYGEAHHRLADLTRDEVHLQRAAALGYPLSMYRLAQLRHDRGDAAGAQDLIERLRRFDDEDANFYAAQWLLLSPAEGDREQALDRVRRLATAGHFDAMALMGDVYALGRDVPRDLDQAARWWRQAAVPEAPDHVVTAMAEVFIRNRVAPIHDPKFAATIMDRLMATRRSARTDPANVELWSRAHQAAGHHRRAADIGWLSMTGQLK